MIQKRDPRVDIVKGFAICAIVFFHISFSRERDLIISLVGGFWKVPIFFLIGGFFIKEDKIQSPIKYMRTLCSGLYLKTTIIYVASIFLHNLFVKFGCYPGADTYSFHEILIRSIKAILWAGSGELVMGAMWFAYVLGMALVGYCIISYVLHLFIKETNSIIWIRLIVLFILAFFSYLSTKEFGITIPRINNTMIAMLLIGVGRITFLYGRKYFDNPLIVAFAFCLMLDCIYRTRCTALNQCVYLDVITLIIGIVATYIVLQYIAGFLVGSRLGNFFSFCGKTSYWIMAFHILGFFLCNSILTKLDIVSEFATRGMYTYQTENNFIVITIYLVFGLGTPFILIRLGRCLTDVLKFIKNNIINAIKKNE